jgi:hypothetical protein
MSGGGGMLGILSPPAFLPCEQCSDARGIDDPVCANCLGGLTMANHDRLLSTWRKLHFGHACGAEKFGPGGAGATQDFLVESRAVELIRRQTDLVVPAQFARFVERFHLVVGKPKAQPLLHKMRLVEILGQSQHPPHEEGADLDRRLADTSGELRRFFHDQYA